MVDYYSCGFGTYRVDALLLYQSTENRREMIPSGLKYDNFNNIEKNPIRIENCTFNAIYYERGYVHVYLHLMDLLVVII